MIEEMLANLQMLAEEVGQPSSAEYAETLLASMRNIRDSISPDPIVPVIMALYDALAYESRWMLHTRTQYEAAIGIIRNAICGGDADDAIAALDTAGFDTMPYEITLSEDD